MSFNKTDMQTRITEIMGMCAPEHQARMTEILTEMNDGFSEVFDGAEHSASQVTELTANNEALRAVNAKLFLRVGEIPQTPPNAPTPPEPAEKLSFDKLFNEKGELL